MWASDEVMETCKACLCHSALIPVAACEEAVVCSALFPLFGVGVSESEWAISPERSAHSRSPDRVLWLWRRLSNVFIIGKDDKPLISLPKGKGVRLDILQEQAKREAQRA